MPKAVTQPYAKGRRQCIFCEGYGVTKEHLFAEWMKMLFPRDGSTTHTAAHITWPDKIISRVPKDIRMQRQGHIGSKRARVVCGKCNNGWLSQLETWAKKAIPPMAIGRRCNLVPEGQAKLATWAVKTAMVAEQLQLREIGITQAERTFLMVNQAPPDGWYVYVGSYVGGDWAELSVFQTRGRVSPTPLLHPDKAPHYVQATTFGAGHILFSVVSSSLPSAVAKFSRWEPYKLIQIWPPQPRSVLWPAIDTLTDSDAYDVANILRRSDAFNHALDPGADWAFTGFGSA